MANLLPQNFVEPPRWAIPSYNYVDIDEGTGVVVYYGAIVSKSDKTTTGILTRYAINSEIYSPGVSDYQGITSTYTMAVGTVTEAGSPFPRDFDVVFNSVPKVVNGKMHIVVPVGRSGNQWTSIQLMEEVYKLSTTGVATLLVSGSAAEYLPGEAGTVSANSTMTLTIPQTAFNVGEGLRVRIRMFGYSNAAASTIFGIGHDPQGRKDPQITKTIADTTSTVMSCYIPFKINIHN